MLSLLLPALAVDPHNSLSTLVTANGYGVTVFSAYDSGYGVLDRFSDHLYQQPNASSEATRDLLYDSYFGIDAGSSAWLTTANSYTYENGTNILVIDRSQGSLEITEYVFAPLSLERPGFVHLLKIQNNSSITVDGLQAFSLHNYHLGSDNGGVYTGSERVYGADGGLVEIGSNTGLIMHMLPLVSARVGCDSVWSQINSDQDLSGTCDSSGDDQVGGLQWDLGDLGPGAAVWVGTVDAFSSGWDTSTVPAAVSAWVAGRSPTELLEAERVDWSVWMATDEFLPNLSPDEEDVYQQALVFLKMAQVRESGAAYGQIPASLPVATGAFTHLWNITWARDAAYAIAALTVSGHYEEARAALLFMIQEGKVGDYSAYVEGLDYIVSVCRYYGDGTEWSDSDANGPNIEFDDFGLFLWVFGEYIQASGDSALLAEQGDRVLDKVADVLVALVDETGLITADSSIWERHWNGNQKHFTYTSLWAVRGLREAAELADTMGDARADTYRSTADSIAAAIQSRLIRSDGALMGNLEEYEAGGGALDMAAVEAFNHGVVDLAYVNPSFTAWEGLRAASGKGWFRNDDGDTYDLQEWIVVDLRAASALRRVCRDDEAAAVEDWLTQQAVLNHWTLPELLDPSTGDYNGPAPMLGFGSGAYVYTLHERASITCTPGDSGDSQPIGEDSSPVTGDSGTDTTPNGEDTSPQPMDSAADTGTPKSGGCGCHTPGGMTLLPMLFALGALRRRAT